MVEQAKSTSTMAVLPASFMEIKTTIIDAAVSRLNVTHARCMNGPLKS